MSDQFHLRSTIAEPLQAVARQLRPFAKGGTHVKEYNAICIALDGFHNKLLTTGTGLDKDWNSI